jgi:hypothetical protein
MPVRLKIVEAAMERVKALYQEGCDIAKKEGCKKPQFNTLIRTAVKEIPLSDEDRADLIHELAKFFGRRGGKKQPRVKRPKKAKPPKPAKLPKLKRSLKKLVTLKPVVVSDQQRLDMQSMSKQAHEDICPLSD